MPVAAEGAAERLPSKYKWVDIDDHIFTPRAEWTGPTTPGLAASLDHLKTDSDAGDWMKAFDAPLSEYKETASNSELYRSYRYGNGLDGKAKDGSNKKSFDGAAKIEIADLHLVKAAGILQGLDPATSRSRGFARELRKAITPNIEDGARVYLERGGFSIPAIISDDDKARLVDIGGVGKHHLRKQTAPYRHFTVREAVMWGDRWAGPSGSTEAWPAEYKFTFAGEASRRCCTTWYAAKTVMRVSA